MKNEATVISLEGKTAVVEAMRLSACEGCHKNEDGTGCSVCTLMGGDSRFRAKAFNSVGARVGDRVVIESHTGRMLLYAVLVFLLPIVVALVCYFAVQALTDRSAWQLGGALVGFAATFVGLFLYSGQLQKKKLDIVITEVIEERSESTESDG